MAPRKLKTGMTVKYKLDETFSNGKKTATLGKPYASVTDGWWLVETDTWINECSIEPVNQIGMVKDWNADEAAVEDEAILAAASAAVSTNPKDLVGVKKPPTHLAPFSAVLLMNQAMVDGAAKYGPYNWRKHPVRAEVYYNAAMRHLNQYFHGENVARDSKVHHLAHAMACMAIIIDAEIEGTLIDDRPKHNVPLDTLIAQLTKD